MPDAPGIAYQGAFGSAHPAVFQTSFCDGSVQAITFAIDLEVHRARGTHSEVLEVELADR